MMIAEIRRNTLVLGPDGRLHSLLPIQKDDGDADELGEIKTDGHLPSHLRRQSIKVRLTV